MPARVTMADRVATCTESHPASELIDGVYDELRRIADVYLRRERPDHTLQPTALVHEAYLRLLKQSPKGWRNREHFIGVAATMMRRVLVNHAETKARQKRGGVQHKVTLDDS